MHICSGKQLWAHTACTCVVDLRVAYLSLPAICIGCGPTHPSNRLGCNQSLRCHSRRHVPCKKLGQCCARLGVVVLYHVLVVNSVFFVLGIWSVRSWMVVCRLLDASSNWCSCCWCLTLMHWCRKVVIAWAGELVWLELFYRSLRGPLLGDLWVLGAKKGKAFLSWYAKVLEFQSCPNWGLGLLN